MFTKYYCNVDMMWPLQSYFLNDITSAKSMHRIRDVYSQAYYRELNCENLKSLPIWLHALLLLLLLLLHAGPNPGTGKVAFIEHVARMLSFSKTFFIPSCLLWIFGCLARLLDIVIEITSYRLPSPFPAVREGFIKATHNINNYICIYSYLNSTSS